MNERNEDLYKLAREKNDFLIAYIMDKVVTGQNLEKLPPHITLLPPFKHLARTAIDKFFDVIEGAKVAEANLGLREFGDIEYFGGDDNVPVRPIIGEGAMALMFIHGMFYRSFIEDKKPSDAGFDNLSYAGTKYRPHMTINEIDPGEGAAITVDSACLLKKTEEGYIVYGADKFKKKQE